MNVITTNIWCEFFFSNSHLSKSQQSMNLHLFSVSCVPVADWLHRPSHSPVIPVEFFGIAGKATLAEFYVTFDVRAISALASILRWYPIPQILSMGNGSVTWNNTECGLEYGRRCHRHLELSTCDIARNTHQQIL